MRMRSTNQKSRLGCVFLYLMPSGRKKKETGDPVIEVIGWYVRGQKSDMIEYFLGLFLMAFSTSPKKKQKSDRSFNFPQKPRDNRFWDFFVDLFQKVCGTIFL
jgi:hypothetical protein